MDATVQRELAFDELGRVSTDALTYLEYGTERIHTYTHLEETNRVVTDLKTTVSDGEETGWTQTRYEYDDALNPVEAWYSAKGDEEEPTWKRENSYVEGRLSRAEYFDWRGDGRPWETEVYAVNTYEYEADGRPSLAVYSQGDQETTFTWNDGLLRSEVVAAAQDTAGDNSEITFTWDLTQGSTSRSPAGSTCTATPTS